MTGISRQVRKRGWATPTVGDVNKVALVMGRPICSTGRATPAPGVHHSLYWAPVSRLIARIDKAIELNDYGATLDKCTRQ